LIKAFSRLRARRTHRKRVIDGSSQDAHEGISFVGGRQTDGFQTDQGGIEKLAGIEPRETIADSHRRRQIPKASDSKESRSLKGRHSDGRQAALDHDDFGSNEPKTIMKLVDPRV
jgi:hypothetical protein